MGPISSMEFRASREVQGSFNGVVMMWERVM
jgi:hypothetical protein